MALVASSYRLDQGDLSQLKIKYDESEKNLECLKKLAHAAVKDYEDLRCKYDQNQKQYEALKTKLKETEDNLSNLQRVLEPACDQFNALNQRLTVERACRDEAEKYATKQQKQNNLLKRQSQMLVDRLSSINPTDALASLQVILETEADQEQSQSSEGPAERKVFTDKIALLEEQIKKLESRLEETEVQRAAAVQRESDATNKCKRFELEFQKVFKQLQDREQAMASIAYASERAVGEFADLKSKYETQLRLREKAEEIAGKIFADNESLKRTSTLLMDKDVLSDARLMRALMHIEDLTKELETLKLDSKQKILTLEHSMSSDENLKKIEGMEIELRLLNAEVARLQTCLAETEEWKEKLVKENEELAGKLDEALRPPPPPPPPIAPPCPLLPFVSTRLIVHRNQGVAANRQQEGRDNQSPTGSVDSKTALIDEMKTMMERITTGSGPVLSPSARRPSVQQAATDVKQDHMNELTQLLGKLKKRRADDESSNVSLKEVNKSSQSAQSPSMAALQRLVSKGSPSESPSTPNQKSDRFQFDTAAASPPNGNPAPAVQRSTSRPGPPTAARPRNSPVAGQSVRIRSGSSSFVSTNAMLSPAQTDQAKVNGLETNATNPNGNASEGKESDVNSNL